MSFKFPFTNYHELNLTWVLDQLKKLFEDSAENVATIENYEGRLTAVETELPLVSETAQDAAQNAAAAATLAQQAKSTADTAQENAIQAQAAAGQVRQEAQDAQTAADAATQAAQQAQATAQNFDGRITQAENDSAAALEASRSFENRVQAAITTANNAAQTATNAQGIATRADQNAALALDTLNAQRSELERIGAEQAALITEETESGKTEIENLAQSVLDSIPTDYTALSALVDKKAPVIINSASGSVASFDDGAENMKIQKLVVNIEPVQAGSGVPSPTNIRPISGWTGAEIEQREKNLFPTIPAGVYVGVTVTVDSDGVVTLNGTCTSSLLVYTEGLVKAGTYTLKDFAEGTFPSNFSSRTQIVGIDSNALNINIMNKSSLDYSTTAIVEKDCQVSFRIRLSGGFTYNNCKLKPMLVVGDTPPSNYNPYINNQIFVNWEDEAGTVYGGTLTLNPDSTGTLVVDRLNLVLWRVSSVGISSISNVPYADVSVNPGKNAKLNTKALSNIYHWISNSITPDSGTFRTYEGSVTVYDNMFAGKTANEVLQYLRDNNAQFVYRLDNPITYQLTAEQVSGILSTLYGVNNIWSNAGTVSVDYPADTKLYIDSKLAELQATILENI